MLLKEANQHVREMARQLNIPMKKMKLLIRHTPIPIGGDLETFPIEDSWHDQLPNFTQSHQNNEGTRAFNMPPTPDLSNSTVSSSASFGSRSLTSRGDGLQTPTGKKQEGQVSANNSLNGSIPGGGGSLSGAGGSANGDNESTNSKKQTMNRQPRPEWPVARYAFKTSSRTPAVVKRDKLLVQRPSTSPASSSASLLCSLSDYNVHTYASVSANEVINSKSHSSLVTVVVRKPMTMPRRRIMKQADNVPQFGSMTSPCSDDWRQSNTYMISRNNLGTTFSPISRTPLQEGVNRASVITQQLLGDFSDVRPSTVSGSMSSSFRAKAAPLRDPNTTYRSGGKTAAGNGMLSHTTANKFRPVYW